MASSDHPHLPPQPAYQATPGSILNADRSFYDSVANAERVSIDSFKLPIRSGRAWQVPAGHIVRISTPDGPQVGDLNIWNLHNPRERFWAARTRQLYASHVSTYDRLWSCLPYLRPMVTIIGDSLADYGVDQYGGRCHDLLGTRCDPYVNTMLTGDSYDFHCHSNLTRAVLPFGLTEFDVHDVLNVFQVTGLNAEGKYFMEASPAKTGDFIEFFAEQPVLMALSTCPGGDLSTWGWGEGGDGEEGQKTSMLECCRPLKVEVFRLENASVLKGWKEPEMPQYRGRHAYLTLTSTSKPNYDESLNQPFQIDSPQHEVFSNTAADMSAPGEAFEPRQTATSEDYTPDPSKSIKLPPNRQALVDDIIALYSCEPTIRRVERYTPDCVYDDQFVYANDRYKMAGQWFALPKLFKDSTNERYEVIKNEPGLIQFKNEQSWTFKIIPKKATINALVSLALEPETQDSEFIRVKYHKDQANDKDYSHEGVGFSFKKWQADNVMKRMDSDEVKYFEKDKGAAKEPVKKYGSGAEDGQAPKKDFST
ncbi:hypothetical protein LTR35_010644 [Friedmanniomyces endolithicus]|uniref:DUF1989 domain-containing protein n=1 Tax=Friedmanniomyces endolithicus TaxID=329885 RepID=A0AAN6FKC3_9PEZI|nr:hypothetical protein LTR35_010644 [Friedmanniomyces endolithicus]KAK0300986.1 hypothetical protein LTS00_000134 [Friedmanniomyces endolithicus]KAK0318737.1 hypothetical protein LTR82_010157 [Friedmanniomyces endolithicus]KAK1018937.1 hypothetical protein LTR54_000749 [Friedmanniomyces endolithicus]